MPLEIRDYKDGIQFSAIIQPRASSNKICGLQDKYLKIRLTSPPVDGAANKMCIKFLAKILSVSSSQIMIVSGQQGRKKIIRIEGIGTSEFFNKIPSITQSWLLKKKQDCRKLFYYFLNLFLPIVLADLLLGRLKWLKLLSTWTA